MNIEPQHQSWLVLNRLKHIPVEEKSYWTEHIDEFSDELRKFSTRSSKMALSDLLLTQIRSMDWAAIDQEILWLSEKNRSLFTCKDPQYPRLLKEISGPPLVLYVEGNGDCLNQIQLAMVGSRNPSLQGAETAESFAWDLAERGMVITSGLATGIDCASHRGAMLKGKTIAVLGTGLDVIYPSNHQALAREIVEKNGALVSEFPLKTPPKRENFPIRNRIISGLAVGVLVVEATLKSGSLITAKFAAAQGREIFAIPGSIHNPLAKGCNHLIKQGAKVVETSLDILEEIEQFFGLYTPKVEEGSSNKISVGGDKNQPLALDKEYRKLLSCVDFEITTVDTVTARSDFSPEAVCSMLLIIELQGYVRSVPGGYIRVK